MMFYDPLSVLVGDTAGQDVGATDNCTGSWEDVSSAFYGAWGTSPTGYATVDYYATHTGVAVGSTSSFSSGILTTNNQRFECPDQQFSPGGGVNVRPKVTFSGTPVVPQGSTATITATVKPPTNTTSITLTLSTTSGSGSATFLDGTSSMNITADTALTILGVQASSTPNNISLTATIAGNIPVGSTSFTVAVTNGAVPVNFRETSFTPLPASAALQFTYAWGSSSGNLADLSTCQVEEFVTYPGYTPGVQSVYPWTSPPYVQGVSTNNPDTGFTPVSGTTGSQGLVDTQGHFGFATPYVYNSVPSYQVFQFQCTNYKPGQWIQLLPINGTIAISRVVSQNPTWQYAVTKSGQSIYGLLP